MLKKFKHFYLKVVNFVVTLTLILTIGQFIFHNVSYTLSREYPYTNSILNTTHPWYYFIAYNFNKPLIDVKLEFKELPMNTPYYKDMVYSALFLIANHRKESVNIFLCHYFNQGSYLKFSDGSYYACSE